MLKYADVFRNANDFFKKSFSFGHSVEVETKTDAGLTVTATGKVDKKKFDATLKGSKFQRGQFKVDKVELGTNEKITGEFSLADVAAGTNLKFASEDGTRASKVTASARFGVETQQDRFSATGEVDVVNGPIVQGTFLTGYEGFLFGGSGRMNTNMLAGGSGSAGGSGLEFTDYDALVGFQRGKTTLAAKTADRFHNLDVAFHHKASDQVVTAAKAGMSLPCGFGAPPKDIRKGISVDIGAQYNPEKDVTISAAADSNGHVRMAYKLRVGPRADLTISSDVDALNLGDDAHRVGTKFCLKQ